MHRSEQLALRFHDVLVHEGNLDVVGEMLKESWQIKKALHPMTITASVEDFVQHGLENGAEGGKALGNGGGGFFLFWVNPDLREDFIEKMSASLYVPVQISMEGTTRIL
jgi:D-glycero-alpha-D-manno-heptose-7-phosphate kinase